MQGDLEVTSDSLLFMAKQKVLSRSLGLKWTDGTWLRPVALIGPRAVQGRGPFFESNPCTVPLFTMCSPVACMFRFPRRSFHLPGPLDLYNSAIR